MNKKELKTKLSKAKEYRKYARYAEAMAVLHRIVAEYPEAQYYYLLAATYLEVGEDDIALQYLNEALDRDSNSKEAYELKGKIYENRKDYEQAEQMYLMALKIDPDFIEVRDSLVDLYWHKIKNYEKTIEQCEFVFKRHNSYTFLKEEMKEKDRWFSRFYNPAKCSYLQLQRYDDAIKLMNRYKYVMKNYLPGDEDYMLSDEDQILYKLYYLKGDEINQKELTIKFKEYYRMSDKFLRSMEKDAEEGCIDHFNWENYEINTNGTFM